MRIKKSITSLDLNRKLGRVRDWVKDKYLSVYWKIFQARWWNLGDAIWYCTSRRVIDIDGDYGSGKTLLAVALSYELVKGGYVDHIFAPIPIRGQCFDLEVRSRWVMVLDEAHAILDARQYKDNKTDEWLRDLRRRESIILTPAVEDVDKRFRKVQMRRWGMLGNIVWFYEITSVRNDREKRLARFALFFPHYYFGAYSTVYSPTHDGFEGMLKVASNEFEKDERNVRELEGWEEFANSDLFIKREREKEIEW